MALKEVKEYMEKFTGSFLENRISREAEILKYGVAMNTEQKVLSMHYALLESVHAMISDSQGEEERGD